MSQEPSSPDRRANPRSPILVREARCIAGIDVFFGYALNVSRGGLFVSSSKRRAPGEVFEIQFALPGLERVFCCRVEVMWSRGYQQETHKSPGFGVRFLDLPDEDVAAIERWMDSPGHQ